MAVRPVPTLRRTADVLFNKYKVAVLVEGCYWQRRSRATEGGTRRRTGS
ncbi:hypothetical protein [Streptomyces niger]|nr:hypothetical protein [Streptomyces niger]